MKQGKLIASMILCIVSCNTIIQTETRRMHDSLNSSEQAQMAEIAEFAEELLRQAFDYLQKIENKLTELALLVKKGSVRSSTNPMKIMEVLTENKMTINALLQSQVTIVALQDPIKHLEVAFIVSEFCNAFIPYITKQINENFKNVKPFKLNLFLKKLTKNKVRSNMSHLEPAALAQRLHKTRSKLQSLDTTVQNVGLTWYNKVARKLDRYVVTPANRYHLPTIGMYTGGIGALGTYSLWKYGCFIKNNPNVPEFVRNFIKGTLLADNNGPLNRNRVGEVYIVGADTDESPDNRFTGHIDSTHTQVPDNASRLAVVDLMINDFITQNQLATLGATFFITSFAKTWQQPGGIHDRLVKTRDDIWNFLRGGEYLKTVKPGIAELKPTVNFKDMVGLEEVKEAFYPILQYIDNPEQLMRIGATPEKGWLLTGPTRTGKSFSVECLCGEIDLMMQKRGLHTKMRYFNISAALVNEYGIKAIIEEVRESAPALIFIDEIDLLGLQRVGNNKLLSDFLTAMQSSMNADPSKIVIIIAATNNPDNIDKALRQNGRFGKEIRFEYPAKKYRMQLLKRELTNMAVNINDFDIEALAAKTHGRSFEDLKRIIRNAMTRSWLHGVSLTQQLLEESIDTELHNIIMFKRKELPDQETRIVATHFAGRALAAMYLPTHEQLDKVTIYARMADLREKLIWDNYSKKDEKEEQQKKIEYGAYLTKLLHDTIYMKNKELIINEVIVMIAGFAAEELLLGPSGFTCHRADHDKAYKLIENLVFGGLEQETLPKAAREEMKMKAFTILKECHEKAMKLLEAHRDALVAIVEELMKKQILTDTEIKAIIDTAEATTAPSITSTTPAIDTATSDESAVSQATTTDAVPAKIITPEETAPTAAPSSDERVTEQGDVEPAILQPASEIPSTEVNKDGVNDTNSAEEAEVAADDDYDDIFTAESFEEKPVPSKSFLDNVQDKITAVSDKVKIMIGMK